jgi:hypothetical protein
MSGVFQIQLDTLGPQDPTLTLDAGNPAFTVDNLVDALLGTSDADTTGYRVKIWGDIVGFAPDEESVAFRAYAPSIQIQLTAGDGAKTIYARLFDDLDNASDVVSDTIVLDTTVPVVNKLGGPTPARISDKEGHDESNLSWSPDSAIQAYKVKVVADASTPHDQGTQIPTTAGSTNVSGGAVPAGAAVITMVKGADLKTAGGADGTKNVKVFIQDLAGLWSVL